MTLITEKGIYFAKNKFYQIIKDVGGNWNDQKERPLVALIPSNENPEIYWAIPMGDYNHRDEQQKKRIKSFLNRDSKDISSCFYHVGKTDKKSIFFISDVVPITMKYIEREYFIGRGETKSQYIIKNPNLISELERKVGRIIAFEKNYTKSQGKPKFRQNILEIHSYLLNEITAVSTGALEVAFTTPNNTESEPK